MKSQRISQGQQQQKKRKEGKGRDSEQESGLLNISQQLQTERNDDESCAGRVKQPFLPILLMLFFIAVFGIVLYRYLWMLNHPRALPEENVPKNPSLHKHLPYEDNKSPISTINPVQQLKDAIKPSESKTQESAIKKPEQKNGFPYKLWIFDKSNKDSNNLQGSTSFNDYMRNWEHYSKLSNATVQKISIENYKNFTQNSKVIQIVEKLTSLLVKYSTKQKILQQIIMLSILESNEGFMIGGDMIFTKPLDFLFKIFETHPDSTIFFFDSLSMKDLVTFDNQNYFVMARRQCPVMNRYVQILIGILSVEIGQIKPFINPLQQDWTQVLLQKMATAFGLLLKANKLFESNTYSLGTQRDLNIQSTPFLNLTLQNHFKYLYSLDQKSLEEMIGPVKFIAQFPSKLYEKYVLKISNDEKAQIIKNSFIDQHFLAPSTVETKSFQPKSVSIESQKLWQFPKVIWTFFTKNHISDPLHQHFLQNLLQTSRLSQFQLIILTESNLKSVFDEPEMRQIQTIFQKMNINRNQNAMSSIAEDKVLSSIIKLKVLNKYGGMFIDHGYFFIENLSWLSNIDSNNHLLNKKLHKFPDAFMFHKNGDFRWWININSGEKQSQEVNYLTKFIVSNKDSLLIKDWLMEVEKNLVLTQQELKNKLFSECHLEGLMFEQIFQVTLQCLLMKSRKVDSTKTSDESLILRKYNVWSINTLLGGDKMNTISKYDKDLCYSFDSSQKEFVLKYGPMGYISPLQTRESKQKIDSNFKNSIEDSIFKKFFISNKQTNKEAQQFFSGLKQDHINNVLTKIYKVNANKQ